MLVKVLLIKILILFAVICCFSQVNPETFIIEKSNAEKISIVPNNESRRHKIDYLFLKLQIDQTAIGYVIYFHSPNVLSPEYEIKDKIFEDNQHIKLRRYNSNRITFAYGGIRPQMETEIWFVPEGAELPVKISDISKLTTAKDKTFLFDRSYLEIDDGGFKKISPDEDEESKSQEYFDKETAQRFNWINLNFGETLKSIKESQGVMIFYADSEIYQIDKLQLHVQQGKQKIAEKTGISLSRLQIIYGGYSLHERVDFWIIPKNGSFPVSSSGDKTNDKEERNKFRLIL